MVSLGDAKVIFEFLTVLDGCLNSSIETRCLNWTLFTKQCLSDLFRVMPLQTLANQIITNQGIVFEGQILANITVSDQDQLLITAVEHNEIIYGSENESIIRRMVLQLLMDSHPDILEDPLLEIKQFKKEVGVKHSTLNQTT